jgi:hypothetical protein
MDTMMQSQFIIVHKTSIMRDILRKHAHFAPAAPSPHSTRTFALGKRPIFLARECRSDTDGLLKRQIWDYINKVFASVIPASSFYF